MQYLSQIDSISQRIKNVVGKYDSDAFIAEMATLCTYLGHGVIPFQPFDKLQSPLRQILYLCGLNLSYNSTSRETYNIFENKSQYTQWYSTIADLQQLDDLYEKHFLETSEPDTKQNLKKSVAYPFFIEYYYTSLLNFEEQTIDRIQRLFTPFDNNIQKQFGITVSELIEGYNLIDEQLHYQLNRCFQLIRENAECSAFFEQMKTANIRPKLWKLTGNTGVDELIVLMKDESEKLKISLDSFKGDKEKYLASTILNLLCCNADVNINFVKFTEPNFVYEKPIYHRSDGRFQVIEIKQIIWSIYNLLNKFCLSETKISDRFIKHRGKVLEEKVKDVFQNYFGSDAHIYHDYTTQLNKGQDLLVYIKGLLIIAEQKSSKKDIPTENINYSFNRIHSNFKEIFQKGYEQCLRVQNLLATDKCIEVYNKKDEHLYTIQAGKVHNSFSLIITLEKFSEIQTDLSFLLNLNEGVEYPYSICIDDLEVLLLVMKREKISLARFIQFLKGRIKLNGRLICRDELEICSEFFYKKQWQIPPGPSPILTHFRNTDIFENYYEKGIGFKNEKNIERKRGGRHISFPKMFLEHMHKKSKS